MSIKELAEALEDMFSWLNRDSQEWVEQADNDLVSYGERMID